MNRVLRSALTYLVLIVLVLWAFNAVRTGRDKPVKIDSVNEWIELVENGEIATSKFLTKDEKVVGEKADGTKYFINVPHDTIDEYQDFALANDVKVEADPQQGSVIWSVLFQFLPILIIVGFFFILMQQMQGGGNRVMSFGKSRARLVTKDQPKITFTDVAGLDEAVEELQEIKEYLASPARFQQMGAKIPKGVLLYGPPGTGKTLLARAVAGEAGVPFFSISGSDFVEMFVGVGASVTGDTPILIRTADGVRLAPIADVVDRYYGDDGHGFVVPVEGVETLGFERRPTGFRGRLDGFGGSAWKSVGAVYRHKVDEIYEIGYLGGTLRTTGDHSVFVRGHGGIKPKAARDLRPGDVLVDLPSVERQELWSDELQILEPVLAYASGSFRAESRYAELSAKRSRGEPLQSTRSVVQSVTRHSFDGYVYDLCGCDNEAFFGGEKPVLLHNSRVRDLFEQAKANAPSIVFMDEIDAVGRHRGAGLGGGHDEREQTLNQLLVEMDGFDIKGGVILIAATNRPDILDPALLRPGRFDRQIVVDRPDLNGRIGILKVHTRGKPLSKEIDIEVLARRTPGFTGADLANVVNEAALLAARFSRPEIGMPELEEAIDRVVAGPERRSRVISDKEKKVIAYHEAGHALVSHALPNADPVHKVSIVSRGRALGYTLTLPTEDRFLVTRSELIDELAMLLGGRVAEEVVFNEPTTGAQDDIQRCTRIARSMVMEFGMSDLGPLALGRSESQPFLGRDLGHIKDYSDVVAARIDSEVRRLVDEAHEEARGLITRYRKKLDLMVERLLEKETLEKEEVAEILAEVAKLSPANPVERRRRAAASVGTIKRKPAAPTPKARRSPKPRLGEA